MAAVGVCKTLHAGDRVEDRSEIAAKRRALESWLAGAKQHGVEYTRWGIAWNRAARVHAREGRILLSGGGAPLHVSAGSAREFVRFKRGAKQDVAPRARPMAKPAWRSRPTSPSRRRRTPLIVGAGAAAVLRSSPARTAR